MKKNYWASLIGILLVTAIAFSATVLSDSKPELGLDLQGGASVVLRPTNKPREGTLDQARQIIDNRVNGLGVAEPNIYTQGNAIIVELPGVKDQKRALSVVGTTAKLRFRPVLQTLPAESAKTTTTTTSAPADPNATTTTVAPSASDVPTTPASQNKDDATVVLKSSDGSGARYQLGPTELTGNIISSARAALGQNSSAWQVDITFTKKGSPQWDALAAKTQGKQLAIELDGIVKSAPTIETANFNGRAQITGKSTEREAKDLALVLRYGSLPVELKRESVQTVSPTLGKESLHAGLIAGAIGLALVLLYILLYYRALGIVVILGLCVSTMLFWSIISYLGETRGLALSLAGVTGIIVSIGVTVDSYIVFFERLKDDVRAGRTVRSSVDKSFNRAFRTIVAADISSLLGALVLYSLTVGSVRGFAFFLGLSTVLDLVLSYFFTRPMVALLGRNRFFTDMRFFGVARGLAADSEGRAS